MKILALLIVCALAAPAFGHDHWINKDKYKGSAGEHCCGDDDCVAIDPDSVEAALGGWLLQSGELVPYAEAMPSEDDNFWRCHRYNGTRRCFFSPLQAY